MTPKKQPLLTLALLALTFPILSADEKTENGGPSAGATQNLVLAPGPDNPRNSEGDFIHLQEGRILFVYSHFAGKGKELTSYLASRVSSDQGRTWSDHDATVIDTRAKGEPLISSVSLARLSKDRLGLFYLVNQGVEESRLVMRVSSDEAKSWGEAQVCTPGPASYVVTNGRVVRLKSGRLLFPAARHEHSSSAPDAFHRGIITCFYSDDDGATWHEGQGRLEAPAKSHSGYQHPTVAQLKDGRLMMILSMHLSPLLRSYSEDGGDTWSPPVNAGLPAPIAPAALARIPSTGDLLLVWNDHSASPPALKNNRTPLTVALSTDGGLTWTKRKNLYDAPEGAYSFPAIDFAGDRLLLGHGATRNGRGASAMATTVITSAEMNWLYK